MLEANIARMSEVMRAKGIALRPHVKTHKIPQIARLQLAAGAAGVTVATIGEAEVFAASGVHDIFIAYPLWLTERSAVRLRRL
ncbi:MAG: alanine racemase, partial [Nocardioides sp.]